MVITSKPQVIVLCGFTSDITCFYTPLRRSKVVILVFSLPHKRTIFDATEKPDIISQCCLYHAYLSCYFLKFVPTVCRYNSLKILIQSNYIPTCFGGDLHRHQGSPSAWTPYNISVLVQGGEWMMVVAATETCWNVVWLYKNFLNCYMCILLDKFLDSNQK